MLQYRMAERLPYRRMPFASRPLGTSKCMVVVRNILYPSYRLVRHQLVKSEILQMQLMRIEAGLEEVESKLTKNRMLKVTKNGLNFFTKSRKESQMCPSRNPNRRSLHRSRIIIGSISIKTIKTRQCQETQYTECHSWTKRIKS